MQDQHDSDALRRLVDCLLDAVSEDGCWRDFDESWNPIITAVATELLLSGGIKLQDKWYVQREQYKAVNLARSVYFLNSQIREDGSFGTDLWDAMRLGRLIVTQELKGHFSSYDRLHAYIIGRLEKDDVISGKSEWRGPGFYACAVEYLDDVRLSDLADRTFEKLAYLQQPDGSWHGALSKNGEPLISPVWHTAQAILTLRRRNPAQYEVQVRRAIQWLLNKQESDGSWPAVRQFEIYFTSYAILALGRDFEGDELRKAVNYLRSRIDDSGRCVDLGGTLMCATVFWHLTKGTTGSNLSFMESIVVTNAAEVTSLLENQIATLAKEVESKNQIIGDYKEKYRDADVVLTKRQVFFLGIFLAFASFGGFPGIIQLIDSFNGNSQSPSLKTTMESRIDSSTVPGPLRTDTLYHDTSLVR